MKKGKVFITIGLISMVAVATAAILMAMAKGGSAISSDYTLLAKSELKNTVTAKGSIESVEKRNVYSTVNTLITKVMVKVGDSVSSGDILCQMDTADVELNLAQQEAELNSTQQNSLNQLQSSERVFNEALANLDNGENSQLVSASSAVTNAQVNLNNAIKSYNDAVRDYGTQTQLVSAYSSVKSAETALSNAQKTYNDALEDVSTSNTAQIASAQSNVESALLDLNTKTTNYNNIKTLYESEISTKNELDQVEAAYNLAERKYQDALRALEDAKTATNKTLEQAEAGLKTAQTAYDNAITAKAAAEKSADQELERLSTSVDTARVALENALASRDAAGTAATQDIERLKSNMESAQLQANTDAKLIAIQKLNKQIKDSTIIAPISGTITAVYAKEGASGAGLLFVIEDTEDLQISTKFRGYDIGRLAPGLEVIITTDYTGDTEYKGVISEIDPAAVKNANGDSLSTTDVEFAAKVSVETPQNDLRIGSNANLVVITESKSDVYSVPYDALSTNDAGESIIFIARIDPESKEGNYLANEVVVETGLETDFYIEIISDKITTGDLILNEASALSDGVSVSLGQGD